LCQFYDSIDPLTRGLDRLGTNMIPCRERAGGKVPLKLSTNHWSKEVVQSGEHFMFPKKFAEFLPVHRHYFGFVHLGNS
jgi:hypothetical protein